MSKNDVDNVTALTETAKRYYQAMVTGDEAELRRLFDRRAAIVGNFEGEFQWLDLDGFIDEAKNLIGQHGEENCSVESVRVDGDIATVAVRGRYAGLWFLDHLSLVEINDHWMITSKSFHVVT
ncbi:nuclear transport factor 2 family protein [Aliiruegeria lutimaris]|uniref:Putative lumazine-binding n=1 Tax=Aliiruegeria lutimaris TaxID=571298 RepID=A0A1G8RKG5_9RHOB|nr:nuclear transport factor 2 family protein [Aliiruegeria lutimaris]SDJ17487.1 Putative lumazine-binding [Aliiruegeria lutimaris]